MVNCSRRTVFHVFGVVAVSGFSGCYVNIGQNGERQPRLEIHPEAEKINGDWQLELWIRHTTDNSTSIHDVTVFAFSEHGEEVCRIDVGDFPQGGRFEERDTIICDKFPAIVTATAEESPCDGANIGITYLERYRNEQIRWGSTFRECNEDLPPERVLEKIEEVPEHE